jgi:hypothetical protein
MQDDPFYSKDSLRIYHTDILKSEGRFCLNLPLDQNKGGQQSIRSPAHFGRNDTIG